MDVSVNFIMIEWNFEALEITLCYYKINRNVGKHVGKPENRQVSSFLFNGKKSSEWKYGDKVRPILVLSGEVRFRSFGYGAWIEIFLR